MRILKSSVKRPLGEEALNSVGEFRPDVVIMDINMPKMDGIEATARITAQYPHVKIVGLSVNASEENAGKMRQAGAAILMTKESAADQLYATIQRTVERYGSPTHQE